MSINNTSQFSSYNFMESVKQLAERIATIDPSLVMDHDEKWVDLENKNIQFCRGQRHELYSKVKKYQVYRDRTALVSKRKYYELINSFARNLLCRIPVDLEEPVHYVDDSSNKLIVTTALLMIWEMHGKWKDKEDLSLFVPPALDPEKKLIIEGYLQTIQELDLEDEAEGTYAYLLHDYCRTMILYNCAMQFVYDADIKTVSNAYGEYAEEAFMLYDNMVNELEGVDEDEEI